jgi:hypothetical protein
LKEVIGLERWSLIHSRLTFKLSVCSRRLLNWCNWCSFSLRASYAFNGFSFTLSFLFFLRWLHQCLSYLLEFTFTDVLITHN